MSKDEEKRRARADKKMRELENINTKWAQVTSNIGFHAYLSAKLAHQMGEEPTEHMADLVTESVVDLVLSIIKEKNNEKKIKEKAE